MAGPNDSSRRRGRTRGAGPELRGGELRREPRIPDHMVKAETAAFGEGRVKCSGA